MSLLGSFEQLVGKGVHGAEQALGMSHPMQGAPIIDYAPRLQQALQGMHQLQQVAPMGKLNAQGQMQWNPSMGGAPIQPQNSLAPVGQQVVDLSRQPNNDQFTVSNINSSIGGMPTPGGVDQGWMNPYKPIQNPYGF